MINLYKTVEGDELLLYGENINLPEFLKLELVKENVDIKDYPYHAIARFDLFMSGILGKRHRDTILEENKVNNFNDLCKEYYLIKMKQSNKSKKVREYIVDKYIELIDYDPSGDNESN